MKNYEPIMSFGEDAAERYDDAQRSSKTPSRSDKAAAVAFLGELAGGGPALELAIGTGRIALPGTAQSAEDALAAAMTPPVNDSGYHAGFDRGPVIGANNWNRGPADGAINIPDDIIGVAVQFGQSCL